MSSKTYILTVDQGTTGTRAVLYRATAGAPVGMKSLPVRQYYPQPDWVEHDPVEILESVRTVMRDLLAGWARE